MDLASLRILRLAVGVALATASSYALALPLPFLAIVLVIVLLAQPSRPLPFVKGLVLSLVVLVVTSAGVLFVPLLQHYPASAVLIQALTLTALFFVSVRTANPAMTILVMATSMIPVAGFQSQALALGVCQTVAVGVVLGVIVSGVSGALFPEHAPIKKPAYVAPEAAGWLAIRAMLIVMPVLTLALSNPAFYMPAIMKSVQLGQQASGAHARREGRELVWSTLAGALAAFGIFVVLRVFPHLWMLTLWCGLAALLFGFKLYGAWATKLRPTFWLNALMTTFIVLGPGIEDSANGDDVWSKGVMRVGLYIALALYAWLMVIVLEHLRSYWRTTRYVRT
ncbi:DUF2955 domain-containing protein [Chitinibacteraceae bacterium HSL-7]